MNSKLTSAEYAQRVVDGHTKGIICSGEVWNQMIEHVTADTLEDYMVRLTPELHAYLQRKMAHADVCTAQEHALLQLLRGWYEKRIA